MLKLMGLELIIGPPNSARAVEIRERIAGFADREPVLVVPTADDAAQFERDLCASSGAVLGVSIRTFASLFDEAARATGVEPAAPLSAPQRLALVRAAVAATPLRLLRRSAAAAAASPPALDLLIAELQAALLDPGRARSSLRASSTTATTSASSRRSSPRMSGCARAPAEAMQARGRGRRSRRCALGPDAWGGAAGAALRLRRPRPRPARADRGASVPQPRWSSRSTTPTATRSAPEPSCRRAWSASSASSERSSSPTIPPTPPTPASDISIAACSSRRRSRSRSTKRVILLDCAGELGEAEAIAAEIAGCSTDGEEPDSIAVVVRDLARRGPLLGRVFRRLMIPAAVEASAPLDATAVGRSLVALCRALIDDDPAIAARPPARRIRRPRPAPPTGSS